MSSTWLGTLLENLAELWLPLTFDGVMYSVMALFVAWVLLFMQAERIGDRQSAFDADRPSSYFPLRTYLSRRYAAVLCYSIAAPLALLVLVICGSAKPQIINAATALVPYVIEKVAPEQYRAQAMSTGAQLMQQLRFLSPLLLLVIALGLFAPYVSTLITFFQDMFVRATGLERRIDDLALEKARTALQDHGSYAAAANALQTLMGQSVPLHNALAAGTDEQKSAYALIFAARRETARHGLAVGLASVQQGLASTATTVAATAAATQEVLPGALEQPRRLRKPRLLRRPTRRNLPNLLSLLLYVALCGFFVVIFAAGETQAVIPAAQWSPSLFEWVYDPRYAVIQMLRFNICFVLPLYLGFLVYITRRQVDETGNTISDCVIAACTQQTIIALFLSGCFSLRDSISLIAGLQINEGNETYSVYGMNFWFDAISIGILPAVVFLAWIFMRYTLKLRGAYLMLGLIACGALAPALQAFGYEWYSGKWRGLYWYFAALGFYTTSMLFVVGFITRRTAKVAEPAELVPEFRTGER